MNESIRRLRIIVVLLALLAAARTANGGVVYNSENQPVSITDLQIGDVLYDLSIVYNVTFDSLYGDFTSPAPTPMFWGNDPGAADASAAIAAALNAEPLRPNIHTYVAMPTSSGVWVFGDYVDGKAAIFMEGGADYEPQTIFEGVRLDPHSASQFTGYASFRVVPEPSSVMLLGGCAAILSAVFSVHRKPRTGERLGN